MPRQLLRASLLVATVTSALLLGACGADSRAGTSPPLSGGTHAIMVVASTNVYGNIAQVIGGDAVQVTSIISDPEQDPHSYDANTQVALALSKAALVIENGGGYDDFVDTMLASSKNKPVVLNAVAVSGLRAPAGGELNEHVWYSFPSMQKLADRIAAELCRADPAQAATFTAHAKDFSASVDRLIEREAELKRRYAGEGVGVTEPVPLYLLQAAGLEDKTPAAFSEAIEAGNDVSAAVLDQTLGLYSSHAVKALVYNEQTSGPITERVKAAADQAGIPVVAVTETLPQGQTYLSWMQGNVGNVARALAAP